MGSTAACNLPFCFNGKNWWSPLPSYTKPLFTITEPVRAPAAALRWKRFLAGARRRERSCRGPERPLAVAIRSRDGGGRNRARREGSEGGALARECGDGLDEGRPCLGVGGSVVVRKFAWLMRRARAADRSGRVGSARLAVDGSGRAVADADANGTGNGQHKTALRLLVGSRYIGIFVPGHVNFKIQ